MGVVKMAIERVGKIFFDDLGTLIASTRWISTHGPGSPALTVRKRITEIDDVLQAASQFLNDHGVEEIADARGKVLFDRNDLERCVQFQQTLKDRFARELAILDPKGLGSLKANPLLTLKNG